MSAEAAERARQRAKERRKERRKKRTANAEAERARYASAGVPMPAHVSSLKLEAIHVEGGCRVGTFGGRIVVPRRVAVKRFPFIKWAFVDGLCRVCAKTVSAAFVSAMEEHIAGEEAGAPTLAALLSEFGERRAAQREAEAQRKRDAAAARVAAREKREADRKAERKAKRERERAAKKKTDARVADKRTHAKVRAAVVAREGEAKAATFDRAIVKGEPEKRPKRRASAKPKKKSKARGAAGAEARS